MQNRLGCCPQGYKGTRRIMPACLAIYAAGEGRSMFFVDKFGCKRSRLSQLRSVSILTPILLAFALLTDSPGIAQTVEPTVQGANPLPPIDVRAPRPPQRPSTRPARSPRQAPRAVRSRAPLPPSEPPQTAAPGGAATPLNTDAVATSTTRLGLTVRETPATVEVIDQQTIQDRGFRTVSETAQGAVGVTAGDFPGEPSAFSMRGFTNSQINTLYNGIRIGPQNMTSRVMDTFNLQQVEFLKGPASLMSGEGAAGGAVNFVRSSPTRGRSATRRSYPMIPSGRAAPVLVRVAAPRCRDWPIASTSAARRSKALLTIRTPPPGISHRSLTIVRPRPSRRSLRSNTSKIAAAPTGARRSSHPHSADLSRLVESCRGITRRFTTAPILGR